VLVGITNETNNLKLNKMREAELEVIKKLEYVTSCSQMRANEEFNDYREWVVSLDTESLKGVIIGCAVFRYKSELITIMKKPKEEINAAKFKTQVAQIYINFAKDVFITKN
jgi:hypothetical protein